MASQTAARATSFTAVRRPIGPIPRSRRPGHCAIPAQSLVRNPPASPVSRITLSVIVACMIYSQRKRSDQKSAHIPLLLPPPQVDLDDLAVDSGYCVRRFDIAHEYRSHVLHHAGQVALLQRRGHPGD